MSAHRLVVISAPSGAGKTTLCQRLLRDFPSLELSISSTTRAPRGKEQNGREYWFLSKEAFETQIQAGRFAEWALVHGNYYGTSKETLGRVLASGKSVLLDIDVQGAESLRKAYPTEAVTLFVAPPSLEELERRLRTRGTDTEETIQRRVRNARTEMKESSKFNHVIVNDDFEQAYGELKTLVSEALRG